MSLIFDIETTGLPDKIGYDLYFPYTQTKKYEASRMVSICIIVTNAEFVPVAVRSFLIKPNGFAINNSEFHGVTTQRAAAEGITVQELAAILDPALDCVSHLIAHNIMFDKNILMSELHRLNLTKTIAKMQSKVEFCTLARGKTVTRLPGRFGDFKAPRLAELYAHCFNERLENAHNHTADTVNLARIVKYLHDSLGVAPRVSFSELQRTIPAGGDYIELAAVLDRGCSSTGSAAAASSTATASSTAASSTAPATPSVPNPTSSNLCVHVQARPPNAIKAELLFSSVSSVEKNLHLVVDEATGKISDNGALAQQLQMAELFAELDLMAKKIAAIKKAAAGLRPFAR